MSLDQRAYQPYTQPYGYQQYSQSLPMHHQGGHVSHHGHHPMYHHGYMYGYYHAHGHHYGHVPGHREPANAYIPTEIN
jgi:hypothetical protein